MLNKIINFSLSNRLTILAAVVAIMIAGTYITSEMDVDVFPDLTAPTVTVMTEAHGMATEEVEQLVSFPIESALNGATNMRLEFCMTTKQQKPNCFWISLVLPKH